METHRANRGILGRIFRYDLGWTPVWIGLLLVLLIAGYSPTIATLLERWNQAGAEYSHGLLLCAVVAYILYLRWPKITQSPKFSPFWAVVATGSAVVWWLAGAIQILVVQQAMLPALLFAVIATCCGWRGAKYAVLPVGMLYLTIPIWNILQPTLQYVTVAVCEQALSLFNVSAAIERTYIQLEFGTFEVARECSGLAYLLVAVTLSLVYSALYLQRPAHHLLMWITGAVLGMVSNWVWVFIIVMVGHYSEMQSPLINSHYEFGWIIFAVAMVPLLYIGFRLSRRQEHPGTEASGAGPMAGGHGSAARHLWPSALMVLGMTAVPLLSHILAPSHANAAVSSAWADELERIGQVVKSPSWKPQFHGADVSMTVALPADSADSFLHVEWYGFQTQLKKLSYYNNQMADGEKWHLQFDRPQLTTDQNHRVREAVLTSYGSERRLIWYWYAAGSYSATDFMSLKIAQLRALAQGRRDATLITLDAVCEDATCNRARTALTQGLPDALRLQRTVLSEQVQL